MSKSFFAGVKDITPMVISLEAMEFHHELITRRLEVDMGLLNRLTTLEAALESNDSEMDPMTNSLIEFTINSLGLETDEIIDEAPEATSFIDKVKAKISLVWGRIKGAINVSLDWGKRMLKALIIRRGKGSTSPYGPMTAMLRGVQTQFEVYVYPGYKDLRKNLKTITEILATEDIDKLEKVSKEISVGGYKYILANDGKVKVLPLGTTANKMLLFGKKEIKELISSLEKVDEVDLYFHDILNNINAKNETYLKHSSGAEVSQAERDDIVRMYKRNKVLLNYVSKAFLALREEVEEVVLQIVDPSPDRYVHPEDDE